MFIIGITLNAPPLREITWASEMKKRCAYQKQNKKDIFRTLLNISRSIDEMNSRISFAGFNHKGKLFLGHAKRESD
jgi:membrane magnesium transporter 1